MCLGPAGQETEEALERGGFESLPSSVGAALVDALIRVGVRMVSRGGRRGPGRVVTLVLCCQHLRSLGPLKVSRGELGWAGGPCVTEEDADANMALGSSQGRPHTALPPPPACEQTLHLVS